MDKKDCIKIGFVAKTRAFKGEVIIYFDDDLKVSFDINTIKSFLIEINNQLIPYFVEKISGNDTSCIVLFEDINTHDEAQKLTRKTVYLPQTSTKKIKSPKDYIQALIGYKVIDKTEGELGIAIDILEYPMQLLLKIEYQSKEVLIPLVEPLVTEINKKKKTITVELPEGFLDI